MPVGLEVLVGLRAAAAVVAADLVAVVLVVVPLLVELRRVLDLVLGAVDEDRLRVRVDVPDHAGREQHLLAEDPRTGVDDDEAAADVVRRLVNLADVAVGGLDLETGQIEVGRRLDGERPHLDGGQLLHLLEAHRPRCLGTLPTRAVKRQTKKTGQFAGTFRRAQSRRVPRHGPGTKSSTTFTAQTMIVAQTSERKPWISKPSISRSVSHSISIATPNQISPRVMNASGSVSRRSRGLRIVFRTPNSSAARIRSPTVSASTPLRTAVTTASVIAFATQESVSCLARR